MNGKKLDAIFACVGGGGLLSGQFAIVIYAYVLLRRSNFKDQYVGVTHLVFTRL